MPILRSSKWDRRYFVTNYHLFNFIKKFWFAFVVTVVTVDGRMQIILIAGVQLVFLIETAIIRPHKWWVLNFTKILADFSVIMTLALIYYTEWYWEAGNF